MNGSSSTRSVLLFLLFVGACVAIPALVQRKLSENPIDAGFDISGYSDRSRNARSITAVAKAIQKSLATWQKILDRARTLPKNGKAQEHITRGDYSKAVEDFKSLKPVDIINFKIPEVNGVGMRGRVGEWTFVVKDKGQGGHPTIEAMKTDVSSGYFKMRKTDILMYWD